MPEKSVLCNFEEKDREIMKMLLSKTHDAEWLEKSVSENWTENNLEQGEFFRQEFGTNCTYTKEDQEMLCTTALKNEDKEKRLHRLQTKRSQQRR